MNLKESETYKNLQTALEKESLAYTQYTFFSDIAKKNGYGYIADVFKNTAHAEKEHGEQWFKFIKDGSEKSVYNNLIEAMRGEHFETTIMYKEFAKKAREEGFEEIAKEFERVGSVEYHHEVQFQTLADLLESGKLSKANDEIIWECSSCGFRTYGKEAPEECPLCKHPKGYYFPKKQVYY